MIKQGIIFIFLFLIYVNLFAQNSISGYIYDDENGETLIGASVFNTQDRNGCSTNNNGYFYMKVNPSDTATIIISYMGYKTIKRKLASLLNKNVTIRMIKGLAIDEIIVTGEASANFNSGRLSLSPLQIKLLPNVTGEADVLKAFQLLPGVQQGAEGSVGLIVRGGSNDQNMYLMDDIPLYYINHLGGFVSVFDASTVKAVSLYKGFFPASYGGRLSSIMDIRLKEGDLFKSKKELTVGTLSSRFFCEGPFRNNKTSYMFSVRFSNLGLFTAMADETFYTFYDVSTKITHRLNDKNTINLLIYSGADFFENKYKENDSYSKSKYTNSYIFGNNVVGLKWFHLFTPEMTLNTTASYSVFRNRNKMKSKTSYDNASFEAEENFISSINDLTVKSNLSLHKYAGHEINIGNEAIFHFFEPQLNSYRHKGNNMNEDSTIVNKTNALQNAVYINDSWTINKKLAVNAGIRYSFVLPAYKDFYSRLEPRLAVKYYLNENVSFHIGYSGMSQYVHLLSNNDGGIPKDLWVPSTRKIKPEYSTQYDWETSVKLSKNYEFKANLYYKALSSLIDYKENISANQHWEEAIETGGTGKSKGIELILIKNKGLLSGYVAYVLCKSTRKFEGLNNGKEYPFKYDYRNQINIVLNYNINSKTTLVSTWTYHTGNAITMPIEKYLTIEGGYNEGEYGEAHVYNGRNGYRMPAYHRLDIGLNVKKNKGEWHFGVYNLYNRKNPYYYYMTKKKDIYVMKQKILFPILPSISYNYNF